MGLPLRGLRVLDLSRVLAGPWCTMLLGDAGANVVKLERTMMGDDTRSWGPPFLGPSASSPLSTRDDTIEEQLYKKNQISTYFCSVNRSKKSIAVDMKKPEGWDICHRLATNWADIIVENFKVGTMERLGLDYKALSKTNPRLIYCSITGFGNTGPWSSRPGYDVIVSGMYGLMSITGEEEEKNGTPAKVGVAMTDVLTGTLAHGGILAALHERKLTGIGQRVDVSLMETQLASLVNIAASSLNAPPNTPPPKRRGTAHESIVPYQTFRCKPLVLTDDEGNAKTPTEQYVVVGAGNDAQFKTFCDVLGISDIASNKKFSTNADRVRNRVELISLLESIFITKSREEWIALLDGAGFPFGAVRTIPEAFKCEQAVHRGMVQDLNLPPSVLDKKLKLPRSPITYNAYRGDDMEELTMMDLDVTTNRQLDVDSPESAIMDPAILPPPMLGQHTEEILTDILGMTESEILQLEKDSVIERWKDQTNTN